VRLAGQRVGITGADGRLGSALVAELAGRATAATIPWVLPEYDLDTTDPAALLDRYAPQVVLHAAAWTDVDGCAREPALARRRNADAVGELAAGCVARGIALVCVSTNEVFDGERTDGRGYREEDAVAPRNPYGASKLAGEAAARRAFGARAAPPLWIVRTAWLFGSGMPDFPRKIVAAADRLSPDDALPVVTDEHGSPTYVVDLARAICDLVEATEGGTFHLVNEGQASRFEWAEAVLALCRPGRALRPISRAEFTRASDPPAWGVLSAERARSVGVRLRGWREALRDYLSDDC
jgi:dTDP-4-dehydrorhamnose reductase